MAIGLSSLSNFSSYFSSHYWSIGLRVAGVGVIAFIAIEVGAISRRTWYGTSKEKRAIKRLGYSLLGYSGRALWWSLKKGVKGSAKLAKLSLKAGKKGGKLAQHAAKTVSYYMTEERDAQSVTLHETSAAAATFEMAEIIRKLANSEIKDHEMKRALEQKIREFIASLVALTEAGHVDENTRKFVVQLGEQITSALIELTDSETIEIDIRKRSFSFLDEMLEVLNTAEKLAKRVESKAKSTERKLVRGTNKEISDLMTELTRNEKDEKRALDFHQKRMERWKEQYGSTTDYEREVAENHRVKHENIKYLIQMLEQLNDANKRMIGTINKIRNDIMFTLISIQSAIKTQRKLKEAENEIDEFAKRIKNAAQTARYNLKSIGDGNVDEIIIKVAEDASIILESITQLSQMVWKVDTLTLSPLLDGLLDGIVKAYRAEEASRIANTYFSKIIKAQEEFGELVRKADLSKEVDATFVQEIDIERMEEQITSKQESIDQNAKTIFIRAINILERARSLIRQHIEFLTNIIRFTKETKNYVTGSLQKIMQGMHEIKIQLNEKFKEQANRFQTRLAEAQSQQNLERLAA